MEIKCSSLRVEMDVSRQAASGFDGITSWIKVFWGVCIQISEIPSIWAWYSIKKVIFTVALLWPHPREGFKVFPELTFQCFGSNDFAKKSKSAAARRTIGKALAAQGVEGRPKVVWKSSSEVWIKGLTRTSWDRMCALLCYFCAWCDFWCVLSGPKNQQ